MDRLYRNKFKNILCPIFINLFFVLLIFTAIIGCASNPGYPQEDPNKIYGPFSSTLSPDGKKIIFYWKKGPQGGISKLATYEIATGKLQKFNPTNNDYHLAPAYSPDGRKIVFIAGEKLTAGNIFIMNADGSDVRQLTHIDSKYPQGEGEYHTNGVPTFSPDGSKIIFVRSAVVRKPRMGTKWTTDWDVYEVDILTGKERRLTNYGFLYIRRPFYLPDGKHFIFSGIASGVVEYRKKYRGNEIYIMDDLNKALQPAFTHEDWTSDPSVARNGDIVFITRTNPIDGIKPWDYEIFINKKGELKRLTNKQFSGCLAQPFISYDGSRIVFEACKKGSPEKSLWIMNSDGTGLREINIDLSELD